MEWGGELKGWQVGELGTEVPREGQAGRRLMQKALADAAGDQLYELKFPSSWKGVSRGCASPRGLEQTGTHLGGAG